MLGSKPVLQPQQRTRSQPARVDRSCLAGACVGSQPVRSMFWFHDELFQVLKTGALSSRAKTASGNVEQEAGQNKKLGSRTKRTPPTKAPPPALLAAGLQATGVPSARGRRAYATSKTRSWCTWRGGQPPEPCSPSLFFALACGAGLAAQACSSRLREPCPLCSLSGH